MNYYELPFEEFAQNRPWRFNLVDNIDALNRRIAREAADAIGAGGLVVLNVSQSTGEEP